MSVPRQVVTDETTLQRAAACLEASDRIALDCETTGLDPRRDRLRLLTLGTETGTWIVDCAAADPRPLWPLLATKTLVGHNLQFDLGFLWPLGFEPGPVVDTILLSRLLFAGDRTARHSLAACCFRELGIALNKAQQKSDWTGDLAEVQVAYAAGDVEVLLPLADRLASQIAAAGLTWTAEIECRTLPAVVWMRQAGVPFDRAAWGARLSEANAEAAALAKELNALAPVPTDRMFLDEMGRNWDSPQEVLRVFRQVTGMAELPSTSDAYLAVLEDRFPIAGVLRYYRRARNRITAFGQTWLDRVAPDGRLYPQWSQIGRGHRDEEEADGSADVGRMTCREPNLMQVPREREYRACVAAKAGHVLVKADYATIELRLGARIAPEPLMAHAFRAGEDLHRKTAQLMFRREEITPDQRQIAKSANFGLLYGMGAAGFRAYCLVAGGTLLSDEEAASMRDRWFDAYPGIRDWHDRTREAGATESRTRSGRRRLLQRWEPDTHRLNSPVQGSGADGLKSALALLWDRRGECPGAVPVIACHDEICVQCPADQAEQASEWLRAAMIDGMEPFIDPIPVQVDVSVGKTWGG